MTVPMGLKQGYFRLAIAIYYYCGYKRTYFFYDFRLCKTIDLIIYILSGLCVKQIPIELCPYFFK